MLLVEFKVEQPFLEESLSVLINIISDHTLLIWQFILEKFILQKDLFTCSQRYLYKNIHYIIMYNIKKIGNNLKVN